MTPNKKQHGAFMTIFGRKRLTEDDRRIQIMKALNSEEKCDECGKTAHYRLTPTSKLYYCQKHLPERGRQRLSMEWQMKNIIIPIGLHLDRDI